jgi:DNA-binding NarL/FixJ family response regulator
MAQSLPKSPTLSPRMRELLAGVGNGERLQVMADQRYISFSAVHNHLQEAKTRLGAKTLPQAVVLAIGKGFLSLPTGPDMRVFPLYDL